jgi:hypothetical protein
MERSATGRFRSEQPRDSRILLELVHDVAKAAVDGDSTGTPLSVTHSEFKLAALRPELVAKYGRITTPNAICARPLPRPSGEAHPLACPARVGLRRGAFGARGPQRPRRARRGTPRPAPDPGARLLRTHPRRPRRGATDGRTDHPPAGGHLRRSPRLASRTRLAARAQVGPQAEAADPHAGTASSRRTAKTCGGCTRSCSNAASPSRR